MKCDPIEHDLGCSSMNVKYTLGASVSEDNNINNNNNNNKWYDTVNDATRCKFSVYYVLRNSNSESGLSFNVKFIRKCWRNLVDLVDRISDVDVSDDYTQSPDCRGRILGSSSQKECPMAIFLGK